jgi:FeS assembly SUF system regulator
MIRMTKQTDYGIVLLTHIARDAAPKVHTARDLAVEASLPLPMVSKILKVLARAGLLVSHRGVKGGYSLGRHPASITVVDIIDALEGPLALTECIGHEPSDCQVEMVCPTRTNWQRINVAVRQALSGITLEEMARTPAPTFVSFTGLTAAGRN